MLYERISKSSLPLQAKLTIGPQGDKYEQEADRVAAQVVQQIHSPQASWVQPQSPMGDGNAVQMQPMVAPQSVSGSNLVSAELEAEINGARGQGRALDTGLQSSMSQAMGTDFSGVRVHTDARSDQLNRSIQSRAFTTGRDVFFRQGEYQPRSRGGQALIAHELAHVVQQGNKLPRTDSPINTPYLQRNNSLKSASIHNSSKKDTKPILGIDPIINSDIASDANAKDLLYGLGLLRKRTLDDLRKYHKEEEAGRKRTIDEYNAAVGIDSAAMQLTAAVVTLYDVRNALEKPQEWKKHLDRSCQDYPSDEQIKAYNNAPGYEGITDEQKWMIFLVREKEKIGLYDFGDASRPPTPLYKPKAEKQGVSRIKEKKRLAKNVDEGKVDLITAKDIHKILSCGTDGDLAHKLTKELPFNQQAAVCKWIENAFFRRTSKLGIDFATSTKGLDSRIHFNLAGGTKQDDGSWVNQHFGISYDTWMDTGQRKITESELREVNRLIEKDPAIRDKVLKYSEFEEKA